MIRPFAIIALSALAVPSFAQLGVGGGGSGSGGGGGQRGNQAGNLGQRGNQGQAGNNQGRGGGLGGGNRVQGKSLFPEGVAVYGYDADNSIIIASGLTRTADGRGLIPDGIEALYGYDADNSIIIKSANNRTAMMNYLKGRMDKQLASLVDTPAGSKDEKSGSPARVSVVIRLTSMPTGSLGRLHKLGFESTGAVSHMSIPGTIPEKRLVIAAIQPFVQKIEAAPSVSR